ncbi:hypothetical protein HD553DRAFT_322969 [Filobasidium floriforme]|uniref:uncharacterized protein n=1 Tax=Filobasidium floriforme TaxID=5210 RepID=UPI001E8DBC59|nr:uncharacterized protein HD553DRAFT_322969 [Filobasidium floriforme]KAH8087494.1 hypothetical protein HD553DRAFT_322969 [Filobasidium floriforme]
MSLSIDLSEVLTDEEIQLLSRPLGGQEEPFDWQRLWDTKGVDWQYDAYACRGAWWIGARDRDHLEESEARLRADWINRIAKRRARSTGQGRQIEIERCRKTRDRRKEQGKLQRPATYSQLELSSLQLSGNSNEATSAEDTIDAWVGNTISSISSSNSFTTDSFGRVTAMQQREECLLEEQDIEKLKRPVLQKSQTAPFRWQIYSFPQATFSRGNYKFCSCGHDYYLKAPPSCLDNIEKERHKIIHGWVTRQMCQEMPWLRNPIAAHLISTFIARNGQCWTERYDTSGERRKHNNRLANRTLRKKQPTRETHIEPAESRGQKRQTGVLSISSQSNKDLLDPQENGTSSMILLELSRDQEETVPFPLFGTNEERAFESQNDDFSAIYPMSASYALLQNTENGPVPQNWALQSYDAAATAPILSCSQPTDVGEVMLPEPDMSVPSQRYHTESQWVGSLDPSLHCSTERPVSTVEALHPESHRSRLPSSGSIAQAGGKLGNLFGRTSLTIDPYRLIWRNGVIRMYIWICEVALCMLVRSFQSVEKQNDAAQFPRVSLGERKAAPIPRKRESKLLKLAGRIDYSLRSDFLYFINVIDMSYTYEHLRRSPCLPSIPPRVPRLPPPPCQSRELPYSRAVVDKLLERPARDDNGRKFPFKNFLLYRDHKPNFEVCRDCCVNWWEPAGKGCRDEVKLFRHKHLSKLVEIEMRKEFPDLETLPHLYVPFVQNRGEDWVVQKGRLIPSQEQKMARQHDFNIFQRKQRQRIRDSKLAESLDPSMTETDESSQFGVSPSSSEGTKPSYGQVFICGLPSSAIDKAWTGSDANLTTLSALCSPKSSDTGNTSTLSQSSPADFHSDLSFGHLTAQTTASSQTAIAEDPDPEAREWSLKVTEHPWLGGLV